MRKLLMAAVATLSLVACGAPSTTDFRAEGRHERHV